MRIEKRYHQLWIQRQRWLLHYRCQCLQPSSFGCEQRARNSKFNGSTFRLSWDCSGISPGGEFYTDATLWIIHNPLVEGPRSESGGVFRCLWWFMTIKDLTAVPHSCVVEPVVPYQKGWALSGLHMWMYQYLPWCRKRGSLTPGSYQDGEQLYAKKHYPTWEDLLLINLFTYLADNPDCC